MENVDIQNKFAFGSTIYQMKGDTAPTMNSGNFIESNAVFELLGNLSRYLSKDIIESYDSDSFPTDEINSDDVMPTGRAVYLACSEMWKHGNYYSAYFNVNNNSFYTRDDVTATPSWTPVLTPTAFPVLTSELGTFTRSGTTLTFTWPTATPPITLNEDDFVLNFGTNSNFNTTNDGIPKGRLMKVKSVSVNDTTNKTTITFVPTFKGIIRNNVVCFDKLTNKFFYLGGTEPSRTIEYITLA